jgi:hypothetical protein
MSNLDHGLVHGNSLTGIATIDAALDALQPGRRPGELSYFDLKKSALGDWAGVAVVR